MQVYWGVSTWKETGRQGRAERERLTGDEVTTETPAGFPGAVTTLHSCPSLNWELGLCTLTSVRHWPPAAPGRGRNPVSHQQLGWVIGPEGDSGASRIPYNPPQGSGSDQGLSQILRVEE